MIILKNILQPFMDYAGSKSTGEFVWEDHYKLRRVSVGYLTWDIASGFGKAVRGVPKPSTMVSSSENQSVMFRTVPRIDGLNIGYDIDHTWVRKAEKDIL